MSHPKHDCKEAAESFRSLLAEIIGRLPDRQRLVISLFCHEELTLREIANVLGETEAIVGEIRETAVLRIWAELFETWCPCGAARPTRDDSCPPTP